MCGKNFELPHLNLAAHISDTMPRMIMHDALQTCYSGIFHTFRINRKECVTEIYRLIYSRFIHNKNIFYFLPKELYHHPRRVNVFGFSQRRTVVYPRILRVAFTVTKWHWEMPSSSASVFP